MEKTIIEASIPYKERIKYPQILNTRNKFLQLLESNSDAVMQYEDNKLQGFGRRLIPVQEFMDRINLSLQTEFDNKTESKDYKKDRHTTSIRDLLLVELLRWFNTEFFTWVNEIPCKICGSEKTYPSNHKQQIEDGIRIEMKTCCGQITKFYRYNDIAQLLITRRGRCGEYANVFTFLCRCLDYDARIVYSRFDHVWTEVYSENQKRWLHLDPSDNVIDAPLMYQHGWKRNIDYIFAYSRDDIQDVTWRYVNNHQDTKRKRTLIEEKILVNALLDLRKKRQIYLNEFHRVELRKRCLDELIDLFHERQPTENELKCRSSGNMAWVLSRGEYSSIFDNVFTFTANKQEIESKQFNICYRCSTDTYERYLIDEFQNVKILQTYANWQSCHYSSRNIWRKVERDWKMVYLARQEGTNEAEIIWKFDFTQAKLQVKSYQLNFEKKIFNGGMISVDKYPSIKSSINDIINCSSFEICAKLCGGTDDIAWQHTQLFRQSLNSTDRVFDLRVQFS